MTNKIIEILQKANFYNINKKGVNQNLDLYFSKKEKLRSILSQKEGWDEENLMVKIPITYQENTNTEQASRMLYLLSNFFDLKQKDLYSDLCLNKDFNFVRFLLNQTSYSSIFWEDKAFLSLVDSLFNNEKDKDIYEQIKRWMRLNTIAYFFNQSYISFNKNKFFSQKVGNDFINNLFMIKYINENMKFSKILSKMEKQEKLYDFLTEKEKTDYERKKANFFDFTRTLEKKYIYILSINPIDYLTMSNPFVSDSWVSCHRIEGSDPDEAGSYQAGCLSYMNDSVSIISYLIDEEADKNQEIGFQRKINRMMIGLNEDVVCFSRLYPDYQDNDKKQILINKFFELFPDYNTTPTNETFFLRSGKGSLQYRDYNFVSTYNIINYFNKNAITKTPEEIRHLVFGGPAYCINCGEQLSDAGDLCCSFHSSLNEYYYCASCGEALTEDEAFYVDGEYYCQDCVNYCEYEEEYVLDETFSAYTYSFNNHTPNSLYVCESCLDEYFIYIPQLGQYWLIDDCIFIKEDENNKDGYYWPKYARRE